MGRDGRTERERRKREFRRFLKLHPALIGKDSNPVTVFTASDMAAKITKDFSMFLL